MRPPDSMLPGSWQYDDHTGGVICEHGNVMELDGSGPCGCESPLIGAGWI